MRSPGLLRGCQLFIYPRAFAAVSLAPSIEKGHMWIRQVLDQLWESTGQPGSLAGLWGLLCHSTPVASMLLLVLGNAVLDRSPF